MKFDFRRDKKEVLKEGLKLWGTGQVSPRGLAGWKSGLGRDQTPCFSKSFISLTGWTIPLTSRMARFFFFSTIIGHLKGNLCFCLKVEFVLSFVKFELQH